MKHKAQSLAAYKRKRNFARTLEPEPREEKKSKKPIFVVQKHSSAHLHYDFRLEMDGILVSWAVPKGPSLNPRIKRLAIETEPHPLAYAQFEGVIPAGEYGAGVVMVWDKGVFENRKHIDGVLVSLEECYWRGTIEVTLKGEKLQGGFALIRIDGNQATSWLLIKMRDIYADARRNPVNTQDRSVITARTTYQIKRDSHKL